jgi:hypothetical protein
MRAFAPLQPKGRRCDGGEGAPPPINAWASFYSTESRPFAKPKSGRIAVKVINHYGDEAMRVFRL